MSNLAQNTTTRPCGVDAAPASATKRKTRKRKGKRMAAPARAGSATHRTAARGAALHAVTVEQVISALGDSLQGASASSSSDADTHPSAKLPSKRPRDQRSTDLAAAMRKTDRNSTDRPLAGELLAALGLGVFGESAGMAVFSEALSTLRVLLALDQIGGYGEREARDLEDALQAVRLRLEAAYSLLHLESTMGEAVDQTETASAAE